MDQMKDSKGVNFCANIEALSMTLSSLRLPTSIFGANLQDLGQHLKRMEEWIRQRMDNTGV